MNTYLVRTKEDQVLVGLFCAKALSGLKTILREMIDPAECEYLVLGDKEGLFVEAQFVTIPGELTGGADKVHLTNTPEVFCCEEDQEESGKDSRPELALARTLLEQAGPTVTAQASQEMLGSALAQALEETIPPVLEPTERLSARFNGAGGGWRSFTDKAREEGAAAVPRSATPFLVLSTSKSMH